MYDAEKYPNLAALDKLVGKFLATAKAKKMSVDQREERICSMHPVYWMEKYGYIKTGKVEGKEFAEVKIIRFKLNRPQLVMANEFCEPLIHRPWKRGKFVVLKHRKVGCSTLCAGFDYCFMRSIKNCGAFIIADKAKHTDNIFEMVELFWRRDIAPGRPDRIPMLKNKQGLRLKNGAMLECDSGETKHPGTSQTLNILHMSENAKWKFIDDGETSLLNSVSREGFAWQVKESTAKGLNKFHIDVQAAMDKKSDWRLVFVAWPDSTDCAIALDPEEILKYTGEEKELVEVYGLTPEQVKFRRLRAAEIGLGNFRQDFPINEREAFLTSQSNYFNVELVEDRIEEIDFYKAFTSQGFDKAIESGKFPTMKLWHQERKHLPQYKKLHADFLRQLQDKNITPRSVQVSEIRGKVTWKANDELRDNEGQVWMWREPSPRRKYLVSVDSAEGIKTDEYTSDLSVVQVIDCFKREQVAELAGIYDEEITARYAVLLATLYGRAMLAIEINNKSGGVVLENVKSQGYHYLYHSQKLSRGQVISTSVGWRTTRGNKQEVCARLKLDFKNGHCLLHSRALLNEMLHIVEDKGKLKPTPANTMDRTMAMSIGLTIIEQTPGLRSIRPEEAMARLEREMGLTGAGLPASKQYLVTPPITPETQPQGRMKELNRYGRRG